MRDVVVPELQLYLQVFFVILDSDDVNCNNPLWLGHYSDFPVQLASVDDNREIVFRKHMHKMAIAIASLTILSLA